MHYPDGIIAWLGLNWAGVASTIIATVAIYSLFLLVTRIRGPRMLSSITTFDTVMVLLFGSVVARTTLGPVPTLATGVVALLTLVLLQITLGNIANQPRGDKILNTQPVLLMTGDKILENNMRATHTTHSELTSKLRESGIHSLDEVASVIMESSGKLSVIKSDKPLARELVADVKDAAQIPAHFFRD